MKYLLLLLPFYLWAQGPRINTEKKDNSFGSIFIQGDLLFMSFEKRTLFEEELELERKQVLESLDESNTRQDSLNIKSIKYQKVNLSFPVGAGASFRLGQHYLGFGFLYSYNKENAILVNGTSKREVSYTLKSWPSYVEWKSLIPPSILMLDNGEFVYISLKYYWLLGHSSLEYENRTIKSSFSSQGNGWGIALGYQFAEWRSLRITGELGYSSILAQSDEQWNKLLPLGNRQETAEWSQGGIQASLKAHWHFGQTKEPPKPLLTDSLLQSPPPPQQTDSLPSSIPPK